jgi:ribosomal protein S17E
MQKKNTKLNKRQHPSKQGLVKTQLITIPSEQVISKIFLIRGKKVMMDKDLALLYGVETKQLKRQVRRNIERFPDDFMLQLTKKEYKDFLRCQIGTLEMGKYSKYLPYAFTEQGVAMLSSVLNSKRAIMVNIQIMRAFVNLRRISLTYSALKRKIEEMEDKYDGQFNIVFEAIKKLLTSAPVKPKPQIGFKPNW